MINHGIFRDQLALDRRSLTELATGLSVIAVAGATLYNLGFFAPIEWSLISLLTVQDLLIRAAVAVVPMAIATWMAMVMGTIIRLAPSHRKTVLLAAVPAFAISGYGAHHFYDGPAQSTLGHLASGYLFLWVLAAVINAFVAWKHMRTFWLVFSLLYIPVASGMSDSAAAVRVTRPISEIETDRTVFVGHVVRVTSAYLLIARGNQIVTMPMSKVREVRRLYNQSPEADFLKGASVLSPWTPENL